MTSLLAENPNHNESNFAQEGSDQVDGQDTRKDASSGTSDGINWEKRYRDLQSYADKEKARLAQELASAKKSSFTPPSTPEEIEVFKREHPEVFNMIQTLAYQQVSASADEINQKVDNVSKDTSKTKAQLAKAEIIGKYPNFVEIVRSTEFKVWASTQTPEVQGWIYSNPDNATLAITALDLFQAQAGNKNDSSTSSHTGSAADAVSRGSTPEIKGKGKIWKGSEIKALSPQQYEKLEEEIDLAWEEGRVNLNA